MLEILLLVFLSKKIGAIAGAKGHSVGTYKVLTFVFWFLFEIIGAVVGLMMFGNRGYEFYFVGLAGAAGGYAVIYLIANNLPDKTRQEESQMQQSSGQ